MSHAVDDKHCSGTAGRHGGLVFIILIVVVFVSILPAV